MNTPIRLSEPDIEAGLVQIQTALNVTVSADNPQEVAYHLSELAALSGLSAVVQASARFVLETLKKAYLESAAKKGMTGNMARDYVASLCANEIGIYELAERQNRALVHKADALRSILSYAKTEITAMAFTPQPR